MTTDYIKKELSKTHTNIFNMSIEDIKIYSMYGNKEEFKEKFSAVANQVVAADVYYDEKIKNEINELISKRKNELIQEYAAPIFEKLHNDDYFSYEKIYNDLYNNNEQKIYKIYKLSNELNLNHITT